MVAAGDDELSFFDDPGVELEGLEGGCECELFPQTSHPVLFVFKEYALFSEDQEGHSRH